RSKPPALRQRRRDLDRTTLFSYSLIFLIIMSKAIETNLSYPIGHYQQQPFSIDQKVEWMADIKFLPLQLENAVLNLDESQLHVPYREGGWNIQQVVHHVADSHMNAYIRFKLGLTEDNPAIKPYNEKL